MIFQSIRQNLPHMSQNQQKLAYYILENYKEAAFLKSTELAQKVGVSNSTVTRFSMAIGYEGYAEMQADLQSVVLHQISTIDQIRYMEKASDDYYIQNMANSIRSIPQLYEERDRETILASARLIDASKYVLVAGSQMSETFASFTAYTLSKFKQEVHDVTQWNLHAQDLAAGHASESCAIVFALQRYPNQTLDVIRRLSQAKVPIILFTDSPLFPLIDCAEHTIYIPTRFISFINPIAICLCIINELILHTVHLDLDSAKANVERWEALAASKDVYYSESAEDSAASSHYSYREYLK